MNKRKTKGRIEYDELVMAGALSLKQNEFWCIYHPDGPLEMTASKDFTAPVRTVCGAFDKDWDDLTEQGFRLGKIMLPADSTGTERGLGES